MGAVLQETRLRRWVRLTGAGQPNIELGVRELDMAAHVPTFQTIEAAVRAGSNLWWEREPARGVWARTAWVGWQDKRLLAVGVSVSLPAALAAAEADLRTGGPVAREFNDDPCGVCTMNALHPVGSAGAVSVLDSHLRDTGCVIRVEWQEERFRLGVNWVREARVSKSDRERIIAEKVSSRWQHGDYVWEVEPFQYIKGKHPGKWGVRAKPISRPDKSKIFPRASRSVHVAGMTIDEVLAAVEEPLKPKRNRLSKEQGGMAHELDEPSGRAQQLEHFPIKLVAAEVLVSDILAATVEDAEAALTRFESGASPLSGGCRREVVGEGGLAPSLTLRAGRAI